jgi:hypothetical protein
VVNAIDVVVVVLVAAERDVVLLGVGQGNENDLLEAIRNEAVSSV